ncbi:MAG: SagB/ThcOx family dehydrogenase [Deltaproteobacteria bacterium]|jgi:SagB-type dehydrogenase family enzyme|nr:SagB/ThcOx family dehydrogenase [Deltaproteobacteria bacterium]
MRLPPEKIERTVSVEQAISQRRTVRTFISEPLELHQFSQLLWAAQGITEKRGFKRSAPSAGALYPMDVYVVAGKDSVAQIEAGVYHYEPKGHTVSLVTGGDLREALSRASLSQMWMAKAPVDIVITADYSRATIKYGKRGVRYAIIEAGHIGQNLFLQAEALGLKAGIVGAFHDNEIIRVMNIPSSHEPLLIIPIGYQA